MKFLFVIFLSCFLFSFSNNFLGNKAEKKFPDTIKRIYTKEETRRTPEEISRQNPYCCSWYFYNLRTVDFGINNFTEKWGERKLEDNWRRSNK